LALVDYLMLLMIGLLVVLWLNVLNRVNDDVFEDFFAVCLISCIVVVE
jgi:hypothetical protein